MMMIGGGGTLTSSSSTSTKIILEAFPAGLSRGAEIFSQKTFNLNLLRGVHRRILKPITPLRSSLSSIKVSSVEEDAETEAFEISPGRMVRVRFQLRKECVFGDHLLILGDHPLFGCLWDPHHALPLNWSDGHVWTLDLDLPVGRLIEFKFILKAKTGDILWQPGPNRCLQTWETNKIIRICEDWDNADLQMMIEEDFVPLSQEENQDVTHPKQSVSLVEAQVLGTAQQISSVVDVENEGYLNDELEENWTSTDIVSEKPMEHPNEALTEEDVFTEEESPVLVPGLFPLSDLESDQMSGTPITHVAVEVINEGKAETFSEVDKKQERKEKGKVKAVSLFKKSEEEAVNDVEEEHYNAVEEEVQQQRLETEALGTPHVLLEKDIQWGRRELYKLLSNFGLF